MKVLYLFPNPRLSELLDYERAGVPENRFYGLIHLRKLGWKVDLYDRDVSGLAGHLNAFFRNRNMHWVPPGFLSQIHRYDLVIVKDAPSILVSAFSRICGSGLVFMDSFLPTLRLHKMAVRHAIAHAGRAVLFSTSEIAFWKQHLRLHHGAFAHVPYAVDTRFFVPLQSRSRSIKRLMCVGGDEGKDYALFLQVVRRLAMPATVVSRNKRVIESFQREPDASPVSLHYRVSYQDLRHLYDAAPLVVIPVKPGTIYPSGLTAALEALAMECPVVAARVPVLQEYFGEMPGVYFYEPGDLDSLYEVIRCCRQRDVSSAVQAGAALVRRLYCMDRFNTQLEATLRSH